MNGLAGLQGAAMFVGSLLLAFVGAACVFRLATAALVVAAGDRLGPSLGGEGRPILTWPRDRTKIVIQSLAAALIGATAFASSYALARYAFYGAP